LVLIRPQTLKTGVDMHTKLSQDNPYGFNRWGFAWEYVPGHSGAHLDFGCHDGTFLDTLKSKKIERLIGVDIAEKAIEKAKRLFPELDIIKIETAAKLPFDNKTFDSITILDVLEHVYEQTELLSELNRVLKPEARIIVTVPGKHLFSFLDMGNLKFRFPGLHRWYFCRSHSQQQYEYRYVSNPDGLIGDISVKKRLHEHFSKAKLGKLLNNAGFEVVEFDGCGFFYRFIHNTDYFLEHIKSLHRLLKKIETIDAKLFESTHLFCMAVKKTPTMQKS
jgi:ubiquinone/menaquinone biosynthesis C-methylase UbiE